MTRSPYPDADRPDRSFPGIHTAIAAAASAPLFGSPRPWHAGWPPGAWVPCC
ncbi:hypothetical protein [Streptomyces sp. NPDC046870]|uniref:hypothetical protein n=1 Tax=Streptomyces sp. NPDC046870 TaxID=3155135 RepID=UPI00345400E4